MFESKLKELNSAKFFTNNARLVSGVFLFATTLELPIKLLCNDLKDCTKMPILNEIEELVYEILM